MTEYKFSKHLERRMGLRALNPEDVGFILEHGDQLKDSICITNKCCTYLVSEGKKKIALAERLRGKAVIVNRDLVITAFQMRPKKLKDMRKSLG